MTSASSADHQDTELTTTTDVLVVGGGPVGLSIAMELALHGVRSMIIDPRAAVNPFRKANGCNARTFEHFRRWGVADEIRTRAPLPKGWSDDIMFVTSMTGHTLAMLSDVKHGSGPSEESAESYQRVPQWLIERVLRARLEENELTETRWGKRLLSFATEGEGEHARIRARISDETGAESTVVARYLIGCDGTRSTVRSEMGVDLELERTLSKNVNVTFSSRELATLHGKPPAVHYWYLNPEVSGHISPQDLDGSWLLTSTWLDEDSEPDVPALVERALGIGVPFEIVDSSVWWANSYLASSYRRGSAFLCGDAIHVHPPTGGYGMNQGIHDAVDLGWKLAAVLNGWASEGLLESFQAERKPVNLRIVEEAVENWMNAGRSLVRPEIEDGSEAGRTFRDGLAEIIPRTRTKQFDSLGLILGYRYSGSPVVVPDGTPEEALVVERYTPTARPGARAPHAWLADGSSLYEKFGLEFTLLDLGADGPAVQAFTDAAAEVGIPMTVLPVDDSRVRELYASTLVLIRPDQHVSWRQTETALDTPGARAVLARVTGSPAVPE